MMIFNTGEYVGFNPFYSLRGYTPFLNYLVEINVHNKRVAIADIFFSFSVISFCALWSGGAFVVSALDFVLLATALVVWRVLVWQVLLVRRTQPDTTEIQAHFQFNVFTFRWVLLNFSVALLFLSGRTSGWPSVIEMLLLLAAFTHLGFALWPLAQGSKELLVSGAKTKRPVR